VGCKIVITPVEDPLQSASFVVAVVTRDGPGAMFTGIIGVKHPNASCTVKVCGPAVRFVKVYGPGAETGAPPSTVYVKGPFPDAGVTVTEPLFAPLQDVGVDVTFACIWFKLIVIVSRENN